MPTLRLFAQAREAAGTGQADVSGETVEELLDAARQRFGTDFSEVVRTCKIWVNGQPAATSDTLSETDEVALLPPVSGG